MRRIGGRRRQRAIAGWVLFGVSLWLLHGAYDGAGMKKPPGAGVVLPW